MTQEQIDYVKKCIREDIHRFYVGTVEESTQRGSADGSWRVPEMQGKEDIHESYDSTSCELCQETSGYGSGDMV